MTEKWGEETIILQTVPAESKVLGQSQGYTVSDRLNECRCMKIDYGLVLMDKDALDAIRAEGGVGAREWQPHKVGLDINFQQTSCLEKE